MHDSCTVLQLSQWATAEDVRAALAEAADPADAVFLQRFFKTGPGEYGEGDVFIGVRVPATRAVVRRFRDLAARPRSTRCSTTRCTSTGWRACCCSSRTTTKDPDTVFERYLAAVRAGASTTGTSSTPAPSSSSGEHLLDRDRSLLDELAASGSLWERRVAVLATFQFIKQGDPSTTLALAERLLTDREDLMHKAVGWMLREVGKRVSRDAAHRLPRRARRRDAAHDALLRDRAPRPGGAGALPGDAVSRA